ncbi:MAG: GNAT family N-acetyltransferase, partial [archaeon]
MNPKPVLQREEMIIRLLGGKGDYEKVYSQRDQFNINFHLNQNYPTLIASVNGVTVGFIQMRMNAPYSAEIYTLSTRNGWQRKGIGKTLLVDAVDF